MRTTWGWALCLVVLAACGGEDLTTATAGEEPTASATSPTATVQTAPTAPPGPETGAATPPPLADIAAGQGAWILDPAPVGFEPVLATDRNGRRVIYYQRVDALGDLYDSPITVETTNEDFGAVLDVWPWAEAVEVNGREGFVMELRGDGSHYGNAVLWMDEHDRWVIVSWAERGPDADVMALATAAVHVDEPGWELRARALGIGTHVGDVPDDHVEEVIVESESAGTGYRLVALTPTDYPLADHDRRLTCYRLEIDGEAPREHCDTHPWWARSGDVVLVYGPAGPDTEAVSISRRNREGGPSSESPVQADVFSPSAGPPSGLYITVVPTDWCWIQVDSLDGAFDPNLGGTGPLRPDPHRDACLEAG